MFRPLFAIFLSLSLISVCGGPAEARNSDAEFVATEPAAALPSFRFEDEKGRTVGIEDFKGRTVILNLWATWCSPCVAEMPSLNALSKKLDAKKFAVVTIAEDTAGAGAARAFFQRHGIDNLGVYADPDGRVPSALKAGGLPTTLLIDPAGREIARLEGGADWNSGTMISYLKTRAP